jgi:lysophospholipase L1-like esterase
MGLLFGPDQTVLFIGDSITDCGRRQIELGIGYVRIVASLLAARYPELNLRFVNMGIGGNTVRDLAERWESDVVEQKPDWLSVSIGINDVWRQVDGKSEGVPIDEFRRTYHGLLACAHQATDARLILMETTVIGERPDDEGNRLLVPYNECIRELADEFDARLVPMNRRWQETLAANADASWTTDGVHPLPAGHGLMARIWLDAVGFAW